ncbi:MAG: hypothetical protein AAF658_17685 [Myxococcota bacterium]
MGRPPAPAWVQRFMWGIVIAGAVMQLIALAFYLMTGEVPEF